jgi:hypothetical protein
MLTRTERLLQCGIRKSRSFVGFVTKRTAQQQKQSNVFVARQGKPMIVPSRAA